MFPAALKATDIEVKFGSNVILDGVSIEIEAGKVTTLLGPNGAGKVHCLKLYVRRYRARVISIFWTHQRQVAFAEVGETLGDASSTQYVNLPISGARSCRAWWYSSTRIKQTAHEHR